MLNQCGLEVSIPCRICANEWFWSVYKASMRPVFVTDKFRFSDDLIESYTLSLYNNKCRKKSNTRETESHNWNYFECDFLTFRAALMPVSTFKVYQRIQTKPGITVKILIDVYINMMMKDKKMRMEKWKWKNYKHIFLFLKFVTCRAAHVWNLLRGTSSISVTASWIVLRSQSLTQQTYFSI